MFELRLTAAPEDYDEHGRPCYAVSQYEGLDENESHHLLARALAEGYTGAVAETLIAWIEDRVVRFSSGHPVDVLEIGGGSGSLFDRFADVARTYVNVDPGGANLSQTDLERLRHPRYTCVRCSAESIPLPDASFEVAIALASLDHIPDYRKALKEARRLLRPGGILIVTLNNRRSWWKVLLARTAHGRRREVEIAREHYFQWGFDECRERVSEFLHVSEMRTVTFFPFVPKAWRVLLPTADVLGKALLRKRGGNVLGAFENPARPEARARDENSTSCRSRC